MEESYSFCYSFTMKTTFSASQDLNVQSLQKEFTWLSLRIKSLLNHHDADAFSPLPQLEDGGAFANFIRENELADADRVLLTLALAALFKPAVLLPFVLAAGEPEKRVRFGGAFHKESPKFLPTTQTGIFLLAGADEELSAYYHCYFNSKHRLFTSNVLLVHNEEGKSFFESEIRLNEQFLATILVGTAPRLDGDSGFPAKRSKHTHTLRDVTLSETTLAELDKLKRFARNMKSLWALPDGAKYRNNFIGIFSGDPGTGKSHTAEAIGNELSLPVYKVNFAQLVSKYIGETEKNLERIFDRFSGQPSILFFDEAESIFSKRTEVKDSHDKHSNNEQSFLLQKIEEYNGIVILATNVQNLSQYFDKAFQRRIRQIITFPFPEFQERRKLWQNALGNSFSYEEDLVNRLAMNYQLTGGGIYNIISEGVLEALDRNSNIITFEMLEPAIMDEFKKTGRKYETCSDDMVIQNPARRYGPGYENRKNF